jgi:TonB family protein
LPPRLVEDRGVSYPKRALLNRFYDRVEVVLILELDETGQVVRASLESPGQHEFDEAALGAAKRLRFEPAERNRTPVAARIRYRYEFEPPPPTLVGRVLEATTLKPVRGARVLVRDSSGTEHHGVAGPQGSWRVPGLARGTAHVSVKSDAHRAEKAEVDLKPGAETRVVFHLEPHMGEGKAVDEPAIEVTVHGERLPPNVSSYTREEVRQIPGAFGDPFRAVETLPGVTPLASGLPFFYLRGAPPGNVGYFLDEVRVPYLFHIGAGPAVVHPAIVERVDLYPSAYPARFGRFAGGIVAASTSDPNPELHGEGNLRLFDVGAVVESGFAGGRGSALAGGRYSYTAALLSLAAPEIDLAYRDFQARISYDLTASDRVSLFSFGSYDLLAERDEILFGSEFYRADARYDHFFDRGSVRAAITLGYDRTNAAIVADNGEQRNAANRSIRGRTELKSSVGSDVLLRTGADVTVDEYRLEGAVYTDPDDPRVRRFEEDFPPRTDYAMGAWIDVILDLGSVELLPGLRTDLYGSGSTTAVGVDPRLAARFHATPALRFVSALGVAHQTPSFLVPLPGVAPALAGGLQRSLQSSAGFELDLDDATMSGATVFYSAFFNMTDGFGSGENPDENINLRSRGSAVGAELFLRRRLTKRFGGFLSYTRSRSVRRLDGEEFVSAFDRTHVVNTAISYDLGHRWRAGARFLYYTGTPIWTNDDDAPAPTIAGEREPSFYRFDVRLEKRWLLGSTSWISFVVEFLNATLNKETWPGGERLGPISIPSLGLEVGF